MKPPDEQSNKEIKSCTQEGYPVSLREEDFETVIGCLEGIWKRAVEFCLRRLLPFAEMRQVDLLAFERNVFAVAGENLDGILHLGNAGVGEHAHVGVLVVEPHRGLHYDACKELALARELPDACKGESESHQPGGVGGIQQARRILLYQVYEGLFVGIVGGMVGRQCRHLEAILLDDLSEGERDDLRDGLAGRLGSLLEIAPGPLEPGFAEIDALDAEVQGSLGVVVVVVRVCVKNHFGRVLSDHISCRSGEIEEDLAVG